jgi:hypothetical protein
MPHYPDEGKGRHPPPTSGSGVPAASSTRLAEAPAIRGAKDASHRSGYSERTGQFFG